MMNTPHQNYQIAQKIVFYVLDTDKERELYMTMLNVESGFDQAKISPT